ncbi:uncharacterized protein LOC101856229 [Aplysia californica]|uniref:Uncharacterized protein LOC101856229 n=1 Tax=Aplysia californica TaxID=6500 RepID=A0ABM1AD30_APLCA|nr:uncharacterized protein LOC101856229 [Aplysia californica]
MVNLAISKMRSQQTEGEAEKSAKTTDFDPFDVDPDNPFDIDPEYRFEVDLEDPFEDDPSYVPGNDSSSSSEDSELKDPIQTTLKRGSIVNTETVAETSDESEVYPVLEMEKSNKPSTATKKTKPKRPCYYCGE